MLVNLFGFDFDLTPVLAFWSPPGWNAYVGLLEEALDFLARTFQSAGMAVIVFTIIVKTILLPLTVKALRSSKAMQDLQPKIKELQKKFGKDRQRLSQETMRLYSQNRVNPMSGCLPMLIQIPIFFGLYRAIDELSKGRGSNGASTYWDGNFLWLSSLADADPYKILPILAGVFQFVQTKMMRPANQGPISDPQQRMMNQMMNFMPLMVVIFGWNFASGPVIYWVAQSVYSVVQQWFITGWGSLHDWVPRLPELPEHRRLGYRAPVPVEDVVVMSGSEEGAPVRQAGMMGWFQKRMEEAERQAAARREAAGGKTGGVSGVKANAKVATATATATAAPEPDDEEPDETAEAAPKRSSRTTSYQDRVDAAVNRPTRLGRPPRAEPAPQPQARAASGAGAGTSSGTSTGSGARKSKSKANRGGANQRQANQRGAQGTSANGANRGAVVPRKSRSTRKERE